MPTEGEKGPILDLEPGELRFRPKLGSRETVKATSLSARALEIAQKGAESVDSKGVVIDKEVASLLGENDREDMESMENKLSLETDEAEIEKIQAQIAGIKTKSFRDISTDGSGNERAAVEAALALTEHNIGQRTKEMTGNDPERTKFLGSVIGNARRFFGYKEK